MLRIKTILNMQLSIYVKKHVSCVCVYIYNWHMWFFVQYLESFPSDSSPLVFSLVAKIDQKHILKLLK